MSSNQEGALTISQAEELIRLLTDGLIHIKDSSGEFAYDMPGGGKLDTKSWNQWEWTHGVALTALYNHAAVTTQSEAAAYSLKAALDWFEYQYSATQGKGVAKNINTMAPFYCLASFIMDGKIRDEKYDKWIEEWAEWIMADDVNGEKGLPKTQEGGFQHMTYLNMHENQLWDDTLMMTVIPLTKIGLLLNRESYIQEAKYQFLLHITYLLDPQSGLWYHGWEFTPNSEEGKKGGYGHNFAKALWARGNCWITLAIPLFLEILDEDRMPKDDPIRRQLVHVLKRQVDTLVNLQDSATGLFHTLLTDPTSYLESSATAGFAAGIFMATRMGLLPPNTAHLKCANTALEGVLNCINKQTGEVSQTSFGTGMGNDLQWYLDIPITPMPYGQALAMVALVEWMRLKEARS